MKLNHTERQWLILSEHSGFHGVYLPSYIAQSITAVCSFMRKENANECMCVTSTSHWKPDITHCVFQSSYVCRYKHLSPPMLFLHTCSPYSCLFNYIYEVSHWHQESYFLHVVLLSHSIDPIMRMLINLRIRLIKYQIKWSDLISISVYLQILTAFLECISFSVHGSDKGPEFHLGNASQPSKQRLVHTYTVRRTLSGFGVSMMFHFIFRDLPELLISMFWKFLVFSSAACLDPPSSDTVYLFWL